MRFIGHLDELLWLTSYNGNDSESLKTQLKKGLTIIWSQDDNNSLLIDGILFHLRSNQLIFLTQFHHIDFIKFNNCRILLFNRPFYCINHNSEDDCNGILFFGASQVPSIELNCEELERFENVWQQMKIEMKLHDDIQIEMLRLMLKRFVIYCTKIYKKEKQLMGMDKCSLDIARKFNSLVETHYKSKHLVSDYAKLLNKSPKTLANLFLQYNQKNPSKIIQERLMLEAKRLLNYTDRSIKDIAYELGFIDVQAFSRFFKIKTGLSPTFFREKKSD